MRFVIPLIIFSRKSDSRIANGCLSDIHSTVIKTPQSIRIIPISQRWPISVYQPLCQSTIMQSTPLSLLAIVSISHLSPCTPPLSLSDSLLTYAIFQPSYLSAFPPHHNYWPSCLSAMMSIFSLLAC